MRIGLLIFVEQNSAYFQLVSRETNVCRFDFVKTEVALFGNVSRGKTYKRLVLNTLRLFFKNNQLLMMR
jgi:hypothetical protein